MCPCICCTSCCQCGRLAKEGHFSNVGWPGTVTMSTDVGLEYHQENEEPPIGRKKNCKKINYLKPWISCQVGQAASGTRIFLRSKIDKVII